MRNRAVLEVQVFAPAQLDHAHQVLAGLAADLAALQRQLADFRRQAVVAADHALEQARMRQVVDAAVGAVAGAAAEQQRQVLRRAGFQEALFQRQDQLHRYAVAAEAGAAQGVAAMQDRDRASAADTTFLLI